MAPKRTALTRKTFVALGGAVVATSLACGSDARASDPPYGTPALLLAHRSAIHRVRVYYLDPNVSTLIAVTPASLERFPGVRIRTHGDRATIDGTLRALVHAGAVVASEPFDTRFGLVYEDAAGRRLFAAFTDARAIRGVLGSHRVAFDVSGPLLAALRAAAR